jgi:hypothetical protein
MNKKFLLLNWQLEFYMPDPIHELLSVMNMKIIKSEYFCKISYVTFVALVLNTAEIFVSLDMIIF